MWKTHRLARAAVRAGLAAALVASFGGSTAWATPAGVVLYADSREAVPGSYLVALRDTAPAGVTATARALADRYGGHVRHEYPSVPGFSVAMASSGAARMAADSRVAYVQQNRRITTPEPIVSTKDTPQVATMASMRQSPTPSWGLDRIDQRNRFADNAFRYATTGLGVHAYVLSSGIYIAHQDFFGRASYGWDFVLDRPEADDGGGRGTPLAGVFAGAAAHSVAKLAEVVSVRVLDGTGWADEATVIAGIDWVTQNAIHPAVATIGFQVLGVGGPMLDTALTNSISSGVTYTVTAGTGGIDQCDRWPMRVPAALTVGATDSTDTRPVWSNFGACLDLFAPGADVTTIVYTNSTATAPRSGPEYAAAHVAGVAALILEANPTFTPQQVADAIVNDATTGKVTDAGAGSPNRLLHTWAGPVLIDNMLCESRISRIYCRTTNNGAAATTIRWQRNGVAYPAWNDRASANASCTVGTHYTLRVVATDAAGLTDERSGSVTCRSGNQ